MRYIAYTGLGLVVLVLLSAIGIWASSRSAYDQTFAHTEATARLPSFESGSTDELVLLSTARGEFRARIGGFESGKGRPLVILLHGFPVTSAMWIELIPALVSKGYRVVAFDQRGYSPGVRPLDLREYVVPELVADVLAVADAIGEDTFHLVGHDWGAAVGWATILSNPSRIISWSAMSVAHPIAFADALTNDEDQQARSSYFGLFVTPGIPELLFSVNDFGFLKEAYGSMSETKINEYMQVFGEPGALTAALNWYRAAFALDGEEFFGEAFEVEERVSENSKVPTLFIWGNQDETIGRYAAEQTANQMSGAYTVVELDAGHWLISEQPDLVIEPVISHIRTNDLRHQKDMESLSKAD